MESQYLKLRYNLIFILNGLAMFMVMGTCGGCIWAIPLNGRARDWQTNLIVISIYVIPFIALGVITDTLFMPKLEYKNLLKVFFGILLSIQVILESTMFHLSKLQALAISQPRMEGLAYQLIFLN